MTIARMKLAIGPAATTAARSQTGCAPKVVARSASDMAAVASPVLAALMSPWNFT